MSQPKINIALKPLDRVIEILGFVALMVLIALPLYYYNQLPDSIPTHYNAAGNADAYGSKASIWTFPIIGLVLFGFLFWLSKVPHYFNYAQKITDENAERQYTLATSILRYLNFFTTAILAYITFATIRSAQGIQDGLGVWFVLSITLIVLGATAYYMYQANKK